MEKNVKFICKSKIISISGFVLSLQQSEEFINKRRYSKYSVHLHNKYTSRVSSDTKPYFTKILVVRAITSQYGGTLLFNLIFPRFQNTEHGAFYTIGFKMLQKLGWNEGQGLGAEGTGIVEPINK